MKDSEFKKWWCVWTGSDKLPENTDIRYAFEAGQNSQQYTIDEQNKRIDEALRWLSAIDTPNEAYQSIDNLMIILKGNKNEK